MFVNVYVNLSGMFWNKIEKIKVIVIDLVIGVKRMGFGVRGI